MRDISSKKMIYLVRERKHTENWLKKKKERSKEEIGWKVKNENTLKEEDI